MLATVRSLWVGLAVMLAGAEPRPGAELITAQVQALEVEAVAVAQRGELSLVLLETPDRALPLEIRIDAGALELDENRLDWSAVVDPLALAPRVRARFRAPSEPGVYEVRASVSYFVCDEQWCRSKQGEVHWTVAVEA
jgi:hypothetical protein